MKPHPSVEVMIPTTLRSNTIPVFLWLTCVGTAGKPMKYDGWTTILGERIREDWAAEGGDDHKPSTSPDRLGQGT
jgi:hypothetical protein